MTADTRPALTGSARAVFRRLLEGGPATRPQIGSLLGLSRPTMSTAVAELERFGYVEADGVVRGQLGRRAVQYRVGAGAGHVIAVDAGSTHVRLRAATLDRRVLASRVLRLPASQHVLGRALSEAVAAEVAALRAGTGPDWGPLRAVGLALPARVVEAADAPQPPPQAAIFSAFAPPADVPVVLENNVNCAAVAEQHYGAARGAASFAYVQIGLKIGMGLVLDNRLVRGRNGAAGEIGHLSFPFAPGMVPDPGEAERYLGTEALIARVRADWPDGAGPPPSDTAGLLALAETGHGAALDHVRRHAAGIGAVVASCVCVVDPGLVVLGGGLGASPLLLPGVAEVANRLAYPVEVRNTLLGGDATVLGIERLAIQAALPALLGEEA